MPYSICGCGISSEADFKAARRRALLAEPAVREMLIAQGKLSPAPYDKPAAPPFVPGDAGWPENWEEDPSELDG
jgi:hypothetical protein